MLLNKIHKNDHSQIVVEISCFEKNTKLNFSLLLNTGHTESTQTKNYIHPTTFTSYPSAKFN